ncbi:translation initiation factor IF-3 [Ruminiclostridium hungatei]|uniref:Translation initiation factor IF-3 n=1 Tax=Ruminiclostridium hungatei TaxID=48256 RepID=A0A1V4SFH9_RUMHU|nr:translation initiation factor IF-3 [Ruminiclostridium hungatei]
MIQTNRLQMNEDIKDNEIRLIDSDGSMLGIFSVQEAQKLADSKNLDLVKIVPNAKPPVCKITDYRKSIFEQAKKEKQAKKNQKVVSLKEVRLSAKIEEHDFNFKVKSAGKFLSEGHKVKVSIRFKGREMRYTLQGQEVMAKFAEVMKDVGTVEKQSRLEGRLMVMIMCPKKP